MEQHQRQVHQPSQPHLELMNLYMVRCNETDYLIVIIIDQQPFNKGTYDRK